MLRLLIAAISIALLTTVARSQEARIVVHPDQQIAHISNYMTGACIEDVNHEIYGGIYSQMIFGESFQEPPLSMPIDGFDACGGQWRAADGVVIADGGAGFKLVSREPIFADGSAGVELFFDDKAGGNAGLILRTARAGTGADAFDGYEIALDPQRQKLVLGRHQQNWRPLAEADARVPVGEWISLSARVEGKKIEIDVAGKRVLWFDDAQPLGQGTIALRVWQRPAKFRNLWIETAGKKQQIALTQKASDEGQISRMWRPAHRGDTKGSYAIEKAGAFVGRQCQRITLEAGKAIGIENRGLNRSGMSIRTGAAYEGYVWAKSTTPAELLVALENKDGSKVYTEAPLKLAPGGWRRLDFLLRAYESDPDARFAIYVTKPGSVLVGHAFLQPGESDRFKGLPLRKDVVEGLIREGLTVLRYGGSMVNAPEYRWKNMIGPRDRRPPYNGTWYPYSTNGWGIIDFLNLCEAAGFLGIPAFNMDQTPQDMADFIEYVNGPADSPWGKQRAADGHPRPYGLKYLELGNEEAVDEAYWTRFKPLAEAIWAKDSNIIIVVGDFAYDKPFTDPFNFTGAPRIKTLAAHKKILELAKEHNREVWFDVHIWNEQPRQPEGLGGVTSFIAALGKLAPDAKYKVVIFELNANKHGIQRALGNAHAINELERIGDAVPIVCSANCLQVDGQNDNGWDQGLLFMNPSKVWPQPPYWVTRMLRDAYLPICVKADVSSPANALDVTAKRSADGKIVQIQVVNMEANAVDASVQIEGFAPADAVAQVSQLSGKLDDMNTADNPQRISPLHARWRHEMGAAGTKYTFPGYSFTIVRFQ